MSHADFRCVRTPENGETSSREAKNPARNRTGGRRNYETREPTMLKHCLRLAAVLAVLSPVFLTGESISQQPRTDPLPSWNDGPAKKAILEFVRVTTDKTSPKYVPPGQRIATFDQDGTLWVEHPMYTQVIYCLERVRAVVKEKPELKDKEPFKTVLSGDREA